MESSAPVDDGLFTRLPHEEGHSEAPEGSPSPLQDPDPSGAEARGAGDGSPDLLAGDDFWEDIADVTQLGAYAVFDIDQLSEAELEDLEPITIDQLGLSYPSAALRVLQRYGDQLLLVKTDANKQSVRSANTTIRGDQFSLYVLHSSGRWRIDYDELLRMAAETQTTHIQNIRKMINAKKVILSELAEDPDSPAGQKESRRTYRSLMYRLDATLTPTALESSLKIIPAVWLNAQARMEHPTDYGVTICHYDDLDANTQYIGCENCIVDVRECAPLDQATGRTKFITASTGVNFNPDAPPHDDVDKLLDALGTPLDDEFLKDLAYCLHGQPNRRWRAIISPPNSTKTTIMNAFLHTLGDYSAMLGAGALAPDRRGAQQNQATPDMETVMKPVRITWSDEMEQTKIDPARLKALSGGGSFQWRRLYGQLQDTPATSTIWFCGNNFPTYGGGGLTDDALADRFRGYIFPPLPANQRDPEMLNKWKKGHPGSRERRERLLLDVLYIASLTIPNIPPSASEEVEVMSKNLIRQDLGDVGSWLKDVLTKLTEDDIISTGLPTAELWQAALDEFSDTDETTVNGMDRNEFMKLVRTVCPDLPRTTAMRTKRADGTTKVVKGWKGWKLQLHTPPDDDDSQQTFL